jgi:hypothetical protein
MMSDHATDERDVCLDEAVPQTVGPRAVDRFEIGGRPSGCPSTTRTTAATTNQCQDG